jgi:hypothetical protein
MKAKLQFSRLEMFLLLTNAVVFGGSIVLLAVGRVTGPIMLMTIGAFLMLAGVVARHMHRARCSNPSLPAAEGN